MKKIIVLALALFILSAPVALAKRSPPDIVAPIQSGHVEFRSPHSQMGCVEAWDTKRDALLWRRQIYVVRYTVDLERDVQDVFIKSIELKDSTLIVSNERGSEYELDLDSLDVKVVNGSLVEHRK